MLEPICLTPPSKGDSYCARSYGQMKKHPKADKKPELTSAPVTGEMEMAWEEVEAIIKKKPSKVSQLLGGLGSLIPSGSLVSTL